MYMLILSLSLTIDLLLLMYYNQIGVCGRDKDVVMVDPMGPTVVAAADMVIVEVLAMVKLVMKDVQEEHLNSTVGLDEGNNITNISFLNRNFYI